MKSTNIEEIDGYIYNTSNHDMWPAKRRSVQYCVYLGQ